MSPIVNGDGRTVRDRLGALYVVAALVISLGVSATLLSSNGGAARLLRESGELASGAPPSGTLLGQNAVDGSEWAPRSGADHTVVLFRIAPFGQVGDTEFWHDVASRSLVIDPSTEFVGICTRLQPCVQPSGTNEVLTLLSSMDPVQMRAIALAAKNGSALTYQGPRQWILKIHRDRKALAEEIAEFAVVDVEPDGA